MEIRTNYIMELTAEELEMIINIMKKASEAVKKPGFVKQLEFTPEQIEFINDFSDYFKNL